VRNESSDSGPAGVIGTHDLAEKDPQRYQRCVDTLVPSDFNRVQCLLDSFTRQDVGEGSLTILKKLPSEKIELTPEQTLVTIPHSWASLPLMNFDKSIYASEALFVYVIPA
jgi:hypothetical protein